MRGLTFTRRCSILGSNKKQTHTTMDTIQEIDDLLELNPFYPEHYEHFHSEAVQVLIDAKYEILRLQTIIAELKSQTQS